MENIILENQLRHVIVKNFKLGGKRIAEGAYGITVEGNWEGLQVAIKVIDTKICEKANEQEIKKFKEECIKLNMFRHSNIVQVFGIYLDTSLMPNLVMERLNYSLDGLLNENNAIVISHETKSFILYQVVLGLRYLHNHNPPIIHCDLSSKNIAISKSMQVAKIVDFGIARAFITNKDITRRFGDVDFMAPEVLDYDKPTEKIDIFSFGCVTLHIYTETLPKVKMPLSVIDPVTNKIILNSEIQRRKLYIDMLQTNNMAVDTKTLNLIKCCLENNNKQRPSSQDIVNHFEEIVPSRLRVISTETSGTTAPHLNYYEGLDKASTESIRLWKEMKPIWKKKTNMFGKCWVTSVAALNEKVYMAVMNSKYPHVYDFKNSSWSNHELPSLPSNCSDFSLVALQKLQCILAIGGADGDKMSNKVYTWNENNKNWSFEYPDMFTARCRASSICYESLNKSSVIVAGGVTETNPLSPFTCTITKAVEVLAINDNQDSNWYVVEQLPHVVYNAIPIIFEDSIYIGVGYDNHIKVNAIQRDDSTRTIIKASIPDLLDSKNENTETTETWIKLPDMPYSSWSINHYKGHLIAFTGDSLIQPPESDAVMCQNVPQIYIYNPRTYLWDCVDDLSGTIDFYLGCSIHINDNTILFLGGIAGTHEKDDDFVKTCYALTFYN